MTIYLVTELGTLGVFRKISEVEIFKSTKIEKSTFKNKLQVLAMKLNNSYVIVENIINYIINFLLSLYVIIVYSSIVASALPEYYTYFYYCIYLLYLVFHFTFTERSICKMKFHRVYVVEL